MTAWVLGLNGLPVAYHDASACLTTGDGQVVAFAEEERFTRVKHGLQVPPRHAARFCLASADVRPEDVDVVAVGWDVPRMRRTFGGTWDGSSGPELLRALLGPETADRMRARLEFVPHHLAHAAAAFHASGVPEAAVLVVDGQGEDVSISIYRADLSRGPMLIRSWSPQYSLGFLYEAATQWLGYGFLEAGKTMALASFGRVTDADGPVLCTPASGSHPGGALVSAGSLERPVDERDSGSIINYWKETFTQIAGRAGPSARPAALADDPAAVRVAWAAQRTVELALAELAALARETAGCEALCIAGGVALNCAANGLLHDPVYVPPVPHDAGVALGAAWTVYPPAIGEQFRPDLGLLIGRPSDEVAADAPVRVAGLDLTAVLDRLTAGQVGAIAEGRAEIGPRALGRRSIIALPGLASVADRLNLLKGREPWRPFGPAAPQSRAEAWWDPRTHLDRYMVGAVPMTDEGSATAAAVRHVDGTTRPQAVRPEDPSLMGRILTAMEAAGMPPVLVNTSFNRRGEPVVNNGRHAVEAFLAMNLDFLILGDILVSRKGSQ